MESLGRVTRSILSPQRPEPLERTVHRTRARIRRDRAPRIPPSDTPPGPAAHKPRPLHSQPSLGAEPSRPAPRRTRPKSRPASRWDRSLRIGHQPQHDRKTIAAYDRKARSCIFTSKPEHALTILCRRFNVRNRKIGSAPNQSRHELPEQAREGLRRFLPRQREESRARRLRHRAFFQREQLVPVRDEQHSIGRHRSRVDG